MYVIQSSKSGKVQKDSNMQTIENKRNKRNIMVPITSKGIQVNMTKF